MKFENIDWIGIKKNNYLGWRDLLREKTLSILTNSEDFYLADYNELGYFHKVENEKHFELMKLELKREGKVPKEWIAKGDFPGIWTALFNMHNTYSIRRNPLYIARFYFKDGYKLYDGNNKNHKRLVEKWKENRLNPWRFAFNEKGESLEKRMLKGAYMPFPSHKNFFEENWFGAAIGYSDYISVVLLLEDAIDKVEFVGPVKIVSAL